MNKDESLSGAQATLDIAVALCKASGQCLLLRGPDPNSPAILAAGFTMAIEKITKEIDPTFKRRLLMQLNGAAP